MHKHTKDARRKSTVDEKFLRQISEFYQRLLNKRFEILLAVTKRTFNVEHGLYTGNYRRTSDGKWWEEAYPIPVIEIRGVCDIEIEPDKVSVSSKLKRGAALEYPLEQLAGYEFEAYDADDFKHELYDAAQGENAFRASIRACGAKEVGFWFIFPFDTKGEQMYEFAKFLRRQGFYY